MTDKSKRDRNLDPHKPAVAAMWLWGDRYSQQGGGSMDFWDALTDSERDVCRRMIRTIEEAPPERNPRKYRVSPV